MTFSIRNGLKMTYYHFRDTDMLFSLFICILPSIPLFQRFGWLPATIWAVLILLIFFLVRCFDDPVKLGYEKKRKKKPWLNRERTDTLE